MVKKIQTDDDKVKSLTRRWIPLKDDKIKFEMKGPILEPDPPGGNFPFGRNTNHKGRSFK